MFTISIKNLEKVLGYKIKTNFKSVGIDTAKKCGVTFITTDKETAKFDWCFLEFNENSQEDLLKQIYLEFASVLSNEDLAIIEEVFVGFSRKGSITLAKMGTMAIAQCINKKIPYRLISAVSARGKFKINTRKYGKGKSKQAVGEWIESTLQIKLEEDNVADALILALVGIVEI